MTTTRKDALALIGSIAVITIVTLSVFWRALVAECLDPLFLRSVSRLGTPVHFIFLGLVVLNLVGGFQALGTLLSVGLMMLPAAAARFWTTRVGPMCIVATLIGGVYVDNKTADQSGAVYTPVAKAKQKAALEFLNDNVFKSPDWLAPASVMSRLGPAATAA